MASGRRAVRVVAGGALLALVGGGTLLQGCAQTLVERAIRARGGPLESLQRDVEARVYFGIPGDWSWDMAYRHPDLFRWTIHTYGEEQSYVYDGRRAVLLLGSASISVEPAALESFRTQVRWVAITALDVVASDHVAAEEVPRPELPPGVASGIRARVRDGGATYLLYFDERDLLVAAEGPISLPPIGSGRLHAEFSDFRDVDGYRLPFVGRYVLDGRAFVDESVRRYVPNDPALTPESFQTGAP